MYNSQEIYDKANKIVKQAGTRDAKRIAKELGFHLKFVDYFPKLLGMYTYKNRVRAIFVNNRLNEYLTQMVIAHEIGHGILHNDIAKNAALQEFELFRMDRNNTEYEANAFAAHLLLDTKEFLEYSRQNMTVAQIAQAMNTEINIALIKWKELDALGYDLHAPMDTKGNFLKDIEV